MQNKIITLLSLFLVLCSVKGFSQTTQQAKQTSAVATSTTKTTAMHKKTIAKAPHKIYFDTRKGSSSPLYNTWRKNANGAGAVTTSPK